MRTRIRPLVLILVGVFLAVLAPTPAAADTDDFTYASWTSEYELSLDDNGRAQLLVTETLVARFPDFDQNRGIVRGLAERYEDANLRTHILSITDESGDRVPSEVEREDGTTYLLLGDDNFVHGLTTYVITYSMQDIMLSGEGTTSGNDEFYWNFLPLRSTQPIEDFTGILTISPELARAFTGDTACYKGPYSSRDRCNLEREDLADGGIRFTARAQYLPAGYGVSPAIGFTSGTATQPLARVPNATLEVAPIALGAGSLAAAFAGSFAVGAFRRRARKASGIVVAQYDVPDDLPPLLVGAVYPGARNTIPAEIVHLAVRGALRIEEDPDGSKSRPQLRRIDDTLAPDPLDLKMQQSLFKKTDVGQTMRFPRRSESFARRMSALGRQAKTEAIRRGLLTSKHSPAARVFLWLTIAIAAGVLTVGLIGIVQERDTVIARFTVGFTFAIVATIVALLAAKKHTVHSPAGALVHEYLLGVREFIRVAEADRLRMLQSAEGAERYLDGGEEVVHLYERLLPYAMLFGEEKSWGKVLEVAYSDSGVSPVWFHGTTTVSFSSQLSSFSSTTQAASTYSTSSSSSGGSTGGGFSGGGGGGGFSGGR